MQYIGSSIKASWRAKQIRQGCVKAIASTDWKSDRVKAEKAILELADSVDSFSAAIHEFAGETDTKATEHALRYFVDALKQQRTLVFEEVLLAAWVSSSLMTCCQISCSDC